MSKSTKLTRRQRALLREALRRYIHFYSGWELTEAWTGLGYRSTYGPVLKAGLMKWCATGGPKPRCTGWLRLTETGAKIVQGWLEEITKPTIIDEILERYEDLQHLAQPPDSVARKAVAEALRDHGHVVITKSLYEHLCERPVWATEEITQ